MTLDNPTVIAFIALFNVIIGSITCFFGFRVFRIYLGVIGFLLGAVLALVVIKSDQPAVQWLTLIVAGIAGAFLFYLLWRIGALLAGLLLGATVGLMIAAAFTLSGPTLLIVVAVCAVVGILLSFALAKVIIRLSTAYTGGAQIVLGSLLLIPGGASISVVGGQITSASSVNSLVVLIIWLAVGTFGFLYQMRAAR